MHARAGLRGTTLLEIVLGLTLFSAFAGSAFLAIDAASRSYRTETSVSHLEFLARKALDDVSERLRAADFASITPLPVIPPASASSLDFQGSRGFVNGAVDWGPTERLAFESDPSDAEDGLDNDADGLVDEGRLVWIENPGLGGGRRTVLCSHVSASLEGELAGNGADDNDNGLIDERGFCVEFVGDRAIARITLERRDTAGRLMRWSSTRAVTPRNTPEE